MPQLEKRLAALEAKIPKASDEPFVYRSIVDPSKPGEPARTANIGDVPFVRSDEENEGEFVERVIGIARAAPRGAGRRLIINR